MMNDKNNLENRSKPADDGYRIPDGYFESLTDRVMDQITEDDPVESTGVLVMLKRQWPAVAAAVLLFCLGLTSILIPPTGVPDLFAGITDEAAYEYVYDNLDVYSEDELADLFADGYDAQDLNTIEDEDLNFAIDELLDEIDPEELIELF